MSIMRRAPSTFALLAFATAFALAPSARAAEAASTEGLSRSGDDGRAIPSDGSGAYGSSSHERASDDKPGGLFGPLRIGALAGVGFPRPLSVEGMIKVGDVVGLGLEYSLLPNTTISGVDTTFYAINADVRIFPFENGFFIGVAAGKQHLGARTSLDAGALGSIPESVTVDTWFINPRLGFLWTSSFGLTLGIDAGVQIPLTASVDSTFPSQLAASQQVTDVANLFGKSVLPTVDLLRIGLLL